MDYIMTGLFILFLFFIFRGYHQSKLEEREETTLQDDKKSQEEDLKG